MSRVLRRCLPTPVAALAMVLWAAPSPAAGPAPGRIQFNRDIRPILSDKCFLCHGPNEPDRQAGLRLDEQDSAFGQLDSGSTAIVPGKPDESELVRRITSTDEFERMPPPDSGKQLTPEEIELLKQWVAQGAEYQGHWAFIPPARPAVPPVERSASPATPIDDFILARLDAEGLRPAPEADRRTLIRRVTLDLIGLPPTPDEVEAFVSDPAPDAYEKVVDRLLRSPHYGEHMARYWLDAARYGDTHGLHLDNYREMWPYRDWVIRAFNENMPFDQFVTEQLAGDLLPEPTVDQLIATGFNRCNVSTSEGGSIEEEVYVRNVVDRVEATSTVFLGLTAGCAVCHDHKYDPIRQRDFYSLFAFFNNIDGGPLDGNAKDHPPIVRVPTGEQTQRLAEIDAELAGVARQLEERKQQIAPAFDAWLAEAEANRDQGAEVTAGLLARFPLDEGQGRKAANTVDPKKSGTARGNVSWTEGRLGKAVKFDRVNAHVELGDVGRFERDQPFSYGLWVKTPGNVTGAAIARMDDQNAHRGYDIYVIGRRVAMHLIHRWPDDALKVTTNADVLEPNRWHHVFVTYDGSSKTAGVTIYVDGQPRPADVNVDNLQYTTLTDTPLLVGRRSVGSSFTGGEVDEVHVYDRRLSETEVATLAAGSPVGPILAIARDERTPEQIETLRLHFLTHVDQVTGRLTADKTRLDAERETIEKQTATTLIFRERAEPKPAYILLRGAYDKHGEQVERATPEFLPPMGDGLPRNRLGLAKWLLSPDNPLFTRVTVNRFWQQCFGTGLVKTSEDFGSQGTPPSHPELLDWLAVEFREGRAGRESRDEGQEQDKTSDADSGSRLSALDSRPWNVKRFMKLLVMSAAYRQDARVTPELLKRDPENRLLARGPRFRIDAELLRDQALALSGLLVRKVGGPGVKPPQPEGIWEAVGYTTSNTARFTPDAGEKVYRRSIYTFWKRTAPPPTMMAFDAPSREACRVRRERTNTPLQALVLMNEQQFFESARRLAERTMHEAAAPEDRARAIFLRCTSRLPEPDELQLLLEAFRENLAEYRANPDAANKLIRVGGIKPDGSLPPDELAAWTLVANLVLNLDEVVVKN
ncbi:MAG TPA: DUF1553 domain-containing protein [Planctomycetaceae bacterium]|nr:DUF1553 domain-containing protein [Planctomycetaceae bacterium]